MSDVGSTTASNATLKLDDEAIATMSPFGAVATGTYRPTNLGTLADPYASPAPTSPGNTQLSAFDGTNPNGTWQLFALDDDDAGEFTGVLSGWSLTITTVDPPPPAPPTPPAADTAAPTGSVVVNAGAARTRTPDLTLGSTVDGTGSAVTQMRFSNDGTTWSPFEAFAASKAWRLPSSANGTRTVWAQYTDAAGNVSSPVSDAIVLDTVRPKVTRTTPANRATGVAVAKTVVIQLSEAVASATVSRSSAYLVKAGSTRKVRAVVRYDTARHRITINPRADLAAGTTYRVTVAVGVRDPAGNQLDQSTRSGLQPKRGTFTTS
jgi:hypothetical protein